jgi:hypothetical protein
MGELSGTAGGLFRLLPPYSGIIKDCPQLKWGDQEVKDNEDMFPGLGVAGGQD